MMAMLRAALKAPDARQCKVMRTTRNGGDGGIKVILDKEFSQSLSGGKGKYQAPDIF